MSARRTSARATAATARRVFAAAWLSALAAGASAQQLRTYTQSETGPQFLTYGLPVPIPIDSLTPVDGFRTYAGVQARLQALALESPDLAAHDVGRTTANRTVWAYVTGDDDAVDVEGRPEAAFFINASTHAREWAAPEVSTGTLERLIAGAGDGGLVRYLLDNTRAVVIPVHNIDGVLQTHRYPTDVLVGQDPEFPTEWPRDGRMRRKNMRGVDEVLSTTADHLLGIDLNRNHPPFWATSPASSTNPNSLVFHGSGAHSEPENQALVAAARLAPETRIRLGIDVHTFSKVYFSSNTARTRLNNIQRNLIARMINHHEALSGARYTDVQDPPNRGIGAAAEYFSYQWLVPGWTLELEPGQSAAEYGGTTVTHGGFILPASQARRVREAWAETHLIAFYQMSGPPHLVRVRYVDLETGAIALQTRWRYDAATGLRERITDVPGTLAPGRRYRAELAFNKPMRWRDAQGNVASLPGQAVAPAPVSATLVQGTARTTLDTSGGGWIADPARVLRYRDDTFAFEFTAPAALAAHTLEISTSDFITMNLDADPSTPADWAQGAWSEYENVLGIDGDLGGADRSSTFTVAPAAVAQVTLATPQGLAGEGDRVTLRATRTAGSARVELRRTDTTPAVVLATWEPGAGGERNFAVDIADNANVDGDRELTLPLQEVVDGAPGASHAATVRVLDNDDATRAVWRASSDVEFAAGFGVLAASGRGELVLDRGNYVLPFPTGSGRAGGLATVRATLALRGNRAHAIPAPSQGNVALFDVDAAGSLEFDALQIEDVDGVGLAAPYLEARGPARLTRSSLTSPLPRLAPLVRSHSRLEVVRSGVHGIAPSDSAAIEIAGGTAAVSVSSLGNGAAMGLAGPGAALRTAGTTTMDAASVMGYPLVVAVGTGSVRAQASLLDEAFDPTFAPAPEFERPACGSPLLASDGDNVFTAHYEQGSASQLSTRGCIAPVASDLFDPAVAFEAPRDEPVPVLRPALGSAAIDAVEQCGGIDQRGAPRPQGAGIAAPPRCDAGAYEVGINPYRGIWSPARSGHGVDIQTTGNRLFLAWYTYEDDGEPTAYQASAPFTGPHWEATLQQSRRDPQTGALSVSNVGRVSLDFADDTHATLGWRFDSRGVDGSEAITASLFAPDAPRVEVTGLWYPPADSGYGATISRRGEITAIGVYYYDAQGNVRWALGTGSGADAQELAMTSFRGFCPDCSAAQNPVTGTPAGTLLAHFHTPLQARLDMQLVYPGTAGGQWNRSNARFVPLNDPVDNDDALR